MKTNRKCSIAVILSFIWVGCSINEMPEIQQKDNKMSFTTRCDSLYSESIDYSVYKKLEARKIMPRDGQTYDGKVYFDDLSFPLHIYWDPSYYEDYNLFGYVEGDYRDIRGVGYHAVHVGTYNAGCSPSRLDLIILCNVFCGYVSSGGYVIEPWSDPRHVSFHVILYPQEGRCESEVLEYGKGIWSPIP